jgi:hypothetical protein
VPVLTILAVVLVICVLIWATRSLTAAFGVPNPIATVIMVVVILICLIWFLNQTGILNLRLT